MHYIRRIILAMLFAGLLFSSCDSWLGIDITGKSQMEKFGKKIEDFIDSESVIHQMRFISADERSQSIMGSVIITFENPAQTGTLRQKIVDLSSWEVLKDEIIRDKKNYPGGLPASKLPEYDFGNIAQICNNAIKSVEGESMKYAGIEYFTISFNEEPGEAIYEFVIDGRPENTPITTKGRYAGVYYYEISFKTDESGELKMKVGDKLKVRRGGL